LTRLSARALLRRLRAAAIHRVFPCGLLDGCRLSRRASRVSARRAAGARDGRRFACPWAAVAQASCRVLPRDPSAV